MFKLLSVFNSVLGPFVLLLVVSSWVLRKWIREPGAAFRWLNF